MTDPGPRGFEQNFSLHGAAGESVTKERYIEGLHAQLERAKEGLREIVSATHGSLGLNAQEANDIARSTLADLDGGGRGK